MRTLDLQIPRGMNRRHFMKHLAGATAWAAPAFALTHSMTARAEELRRDHKSCILLWMGGGPPSIDIWDMKPGMATGGPHVPMATSGAGQINSLLPSLAKQMHRLSIVRSMSTQEADHERGRYYMHTGFVPDRNVVHPSYGAVVAHELAREVRSLELPPFISIGGPSEGPGFLGMAYAPFQVDSNGRVRHTKASVGEARLMDRMQLLGMMEGRFIRENRGSAAEEHAKVLQSTLDLLTSRQTEAFQLDREKQAARDRYGNTSFGRSCLMARRLVETGVPFVEVNMGGWDLHENCFTALETKLPEMDRAMSALVDDLAASGLLQHTVVLWMGEFGRTPGINSASGRDHWARSWSVVAGGGGIEGGRVVGATNEDGTRVTTTTYNSQDLMATVCQAMGISLGKTYTARNGRPMKIAGGGNPIQELFA